MITDASSEATANLVETYFRLAQATPGSTLWTRGNLRGCTGAFGHPICNFVIAGRLDDTDVTELRHVTDGREPFHVYLLPGAHREHTARHLTDLGLRPIYKLVQMAADPLHELASVHPIEATTHAARLVLSRFMVNQFFASQPRQYREGIARSTARAGSLDLYAVGFQGEVIAGLMLCRDSSTLGVYNLCVTQGSRNQGWGRAILNWARICAGLEGRTLTLQCDERLAGWYAKAGFRQIGEIVAYSRLTVEPFDTM